jgi:hypothetical protein
VTTARHVPLKTVALPNEHGAWGFLLEPALLGLMLAPSWAGGLLVLSGLGALLAQHPLSLALSDVRRGRTYPRTRLAWGFALGYGLLALTCLLAALAVAGSWTFLLPLLAVAPLVLLQLGFDAYGRGRALLPELAGVIAMPALAASLALVGGRTEGLAFVLWLTLVARNVPSILYVRARLRLERGEDVRVLPAVLVNVSAFALVLALVPSGWLPTLTLVGFGLLLLRAVIGLSSLRRPTVAKVIGIREMMFGLLTVLCIVAGYRLGAV